MLETAFYFVYSCVIPSTVIFMGYRWLVHQDGYTMGTIRTSAAMLIVLISIIWPLGLLGLITLAYDALKKAQA